MSATSNVTSQQRSRARSFGTRRAAATGHHLASRTAMATLARGGSLVDAMIAASAVLTVALPHATSLGGCAMMLFHDTTSKQTFALNGSGTAPAAAIPSRFAAQTAIDARGPRSWVVPGLVALWARAHERFGRLAWHTLFADAIAEADDGIGFSSEIARNLVLAKPEVREQPGFAQAFQIDGRDRAAGERYRQSALAGTLRQIAEQGASAFYRGPIAHALADFSRAHGGLLAYEDFCGFDADWSEPVRQVFGEHEVNVMPPNSVGVLMLAQLSHSYTSRYATSDDATLAQILIARERLGRLHDRVANPTEQWPLDADRADEKRAPAAGGHEPGDTAGIVLADAEGNALTMLQSVFQPFGSGCVDPSTGILMNNRLHEFSLDPSKHNVLAPGKRPVHTLNPYIVMREGRPAWCAVSPGGVSQTTTGVQFLSNVLDRGMTLSDAIDAPRWSLSRDGNILCEPGFPANVIARLESQGIAVTRDSLHPFYFGSLKAVRLHQGGVLEASADQRREASAMVE
ncbi:gamma-glutamyltransferase family protein [Burkholderia sp. 22PA0099]|uniref:gamma-glutamyltransferase family protein n=1 Tax=Burkholderia sp. 22PA0099 TaxID=3237372 RepID=UPI0039C21BF6